MAPSPPAYSCKYRIPRSLEWLTVTALLLTAIALRAPLLTFNTPWTDEMYTIDVVRRPAKEFWARLMLEDHPPLYYVAARAAYRLTGGDPFAPRAVSLIVGVLTLPAFYLVCRAAGGVSTGLVGLGLMALSPFHIHYSLDARNYALALLFQSLMLLALMPLLHRSHPRWSRSDSLLAVLYAVFAWLALWTHNLSALVIFAIGTALIIHEMIGRHYARAAAYAGLHAIIAGVHMPMLLHMAAQAARAKMHFNWMPPPTPQGLLACFGTHLPFGSHFPRGLGYSALDVAIAAAHWPGITAILLGALGLAGARGLRRRPAISNSEQPALMLVALFMLLIPLAITYQVSSWHVRMFYPPRYSVMQLPAFLLLVALCTTNLRPRIFGWLSAGLLAALMLPLAIGFHIRPISAETRQVMARAEALLQGGEPLYFTTDMEFSVKGIELEAQSRPEPISVKPLHELFYASPTFAVNELPRRLVIYDWSAANDPSSGKRGTFALHVLRQHGLAVPMLMSEHGWPEPLLLEIRDIAWPSVQTVAARHLAPWSDWNDLPWLIRRDAGGGEFVERIGYAAPDMAPEGLFRWLVGGYSEFYLHRADLGGDLPEGDYVFIVSLERHPATQGRPMQVAVTITNGERQAVDLPVGSHVFALPFRIDASSPRGIMRIEFHYDTWIPAEFGVGGDTRPLGPRLQWYGILPANFADIPAVRGPKAP